MSGGTTIVDRLNKLSGKDATTITKAVENLEDVIGGGGSGSSSNMFVVHIHLCGMDWIIDESFEEIEQAVANGAIIVGVQDGSIFSFHRVYGEDGQFHYFTGLSCDMGSGSRIVNVETMVFKYERNGKVHQYNARLYTNEY